MSSYTHHSIPSDYDVEDVVQAYDAIPPPQVIIALPATVPPPMFDSQDLFPPEEVSLTKDIKTPIESPIPVSPSSSVTSS
ncbi:hypothetical protein Tco_0094511, partial [Tanacetum coccineum]